MTSESSVVFCFVLLEASRTFTNPSSLTLSIPQVGGALVLIFTLAKASKMFDLLFRCWIQFEGRYAGPQDPLQKFCHSSVFSEMRALTYVSEGAFLLRNLPRPSRSSANPVKSLSEFFRE